MTLAGIAKSPIGTTDISVGVNEYSTRPGTEFMAVHFERMHQRVKPVVFYAATRAEALAKAVEYDKKRKGRVTSDE